MFLRFLVAIVIPRVALAATASVCLRRLGEDGVLPTLGAWVGCLFWTFASVTGGSPYRPHSAPRSEAPTREERDLERAAKSDALFLRLFLGGFALVMGGSLFLSAAQATAAHRDWQAFVLVMAVADGIVTILLLWWFNGWQSFVRAEAWREVRRAHNRHRDLIGDEYPLPMILAELHALGGDVDPATAWKTANDILRRLNAAARKANEDRARERAAREAEERERSKAAVALPPVAEEPVFTPPLDSDEPELAEPVPDEPPPDLRAEWETTRERIKEEAKRRGMPEDVLVGELERIDEVFRKRMGGSK